MSESERAEFRECLLDCIQQLPKQQRIVASVFVHNYECFQSETFERLAAAVGRVTGKTQNKDAVKRAWYAARKKIRDALVRKGFDFVDWRVSCLE